MIPISKKHSCKWTDPTDGTEFEFAPVTGELEIDLYHAVSSVSVDPEPFIGNAEKALDAKHKGKRWKKGERENAVRTAAIQMAAQADGRNLGFTKEETIGIYKVVDSIVLSCKSKDGEKTTFNKDATTFFHLPEIINLFNAIVESVHLTGEDKKN